MRKFMLVFSIISILSIFAGCKKEDKDQKEEIEVNNKSYIVKKESGWVSINDEIFISTGEFYGVNLVLVVSDKKATVIDTGLAAKEANRVKNYIEKHDITLKNLICTHLHSDHNNQYSTFKTKEVEYYEHTNVTDNQEIIMGDVTMKIIFTPGHYYNKHISVLINNEILVAGDIIVNPDSVDLMDVLNSGGNLATAISTLEKLNETNYSFIIPGHGSLSIGNELLEYNLNTLKEKQNQ